MFDKPKTLVDLLKQASGGKNAFGEIGLDDGAIFAGQVMDAAKKFQVDLKSMPELKHADLDGDGKIEKEELAALIKAAHEKRSGTDTKLVRGAENGVDNGRVIINREYDAAITAEDIRAMSDSVVVTQAKETYERQTYVPSLKPRNSPEENLLFNSYRFGSSQSDKGNDVLDELLKKEGFQEKHRAGITNGVDTSESERATASNIRSGLPVSKGNAQGI